MPNPAPSPSTSPSPARAPARGFFRTWLALGAQSFGGGPAAFVMIQRAAVEEHRWVSAEEFTRLWALCQLAPGINLLGLTVLLGRAVGGARGVALALAGFLLPSVSVALVMTAIYAQLKSSDVATAAMRGVIPAVVGIGLLGLVQMARPLYAEARARGASDLLLDGAIAVGAALVFAVLHVRAPAVLLGAGALVALLRAARARWRAPR